MDPKAIIDVVCKTGIENLASEIGALLGQDLSCSDVRLQLTSKETLFSNPERPTTALTRMSIGGDTEGDSFLLAQLDAAIYLGGTLIMLPEDMIAEHTQSGKLDGELEDAFGEVANIIAGVFTQAFVDKYPSAVRFIKKSVEELVPTKIDIASAEPFPDGTYYVASCQMATGEKSLGLLELVVPAAAFGLEEEKAEIPAAATPAATPAQQPETNSEPITTKPPSEPIEAPSVAAPKMPFTDAKKLTDVIFKATINQIGEEIGALLGQDLVCDDAKLLMVSKSEFFATHCTDKVTMANMKVTGDRDGNGFMFTPLADAIILGGTLIMLPEEQIDEQLAKKQFDGEVEDAFGEVANILAGGLTQVFLDRYPRQLRFVRTESSIITPTKIDPAGDDPFPEGDYYLASFALHLDGKDLNRILLLFPAHVFDLEGYQQDQEVGTSRQPTTSPQTANGTTGTATDPSQPSGTATTAQTATTGATTQQAATDPAPVPSGPPLILIIAEEKDAAQHFADILSSADFESKTLNFQEDIKKIFREYQVLGAILIMSQVNEKGFATAIKLQSTGQTLPPMIFAGPEWTRTTVLRAVKYGARDILVMPASGAEIEEKISLHFSKAS